MDPLAAADKLINAVDDNYLSEQESEDIRTERYSLALNSDAWLPKNIRPLITMFTGLIWGIGVLWWFRLWEIYGAEFASDHWHVVVAIGAPFMTCIGFYFHSRRQEKLQQKKADTALKIERMKTRHEIKEERRDNRQERKK